MAIDVKNLLQGPGRLYYRVFDEDNPTEGEPDNTAINTSPASSAWTDVGGTQDGLTMEIAREFTPLAVDQIIDTPDRRQTTREMSLATNMAEVTLENLAVASNEDPSVNVTSDTGWKQYEPDDNPFLPRYLKLLFDGYAPRGFRRRVIGRRMLSIDPIQTAYKKDSQAVYTVKWAGHYVSEAVRPYKVVDQTA